MLFDLDGTLLDTAPDMGGALNELRLESGLKPLPAVLIRSRVSQGASALVHLAFEESSPALHQDRLARFLVLYRNRLARETRPFEGMTDILDRLEALGIPWGVVTNKPRMLTEPLLEAVGLLSRARIVVSGDSLPEKKPSPAPLLYAATRLPADAVDCVYIGDSESDMIAARRAGMRSVAARFGYTDAEDATERWPADAWIDSPEDLYEWIAR